MFNITSEQLKAFFSTPLALLVLMFAAAMGSAIKQLIVGRRGGADITFKEYFARVETLIMIGGVVTAWLALIFTDSLNAASALGFGYVANDAADAATKDGRSGALVSNTTTVSTSVTTPVTPSTKDTPP